MRAVPSFAAAVLSLVSVASAQTVLVPPVEISALGHDHYSDGTPHTSTEDRVWFPCLDVVGACNGQGFTASIGTGNTLVFRFEAPAGKRFVVTLVPGGTQYFHASGDWETNSGDTGTNLVSPSITFENFAGVSPTLVLPHNYVSDNGQRLHTENLYVVNGDFSFTALDVQFTVGHALVPASRTYNPIGFNNNGSFDYGSFGSGRQFYGTAPDTISMSIEPLPGTAFCFGDGTDTACPCSNSGSPGRGCQNSSTTGGALLSAAGTSNPDTMVLNASGEKPSALTIFLQGTQAISAVPYGDGLRCVNGVLKRLYTKTASGGAVSAPQGSDLSITARSAQMNHPIAPGSTRYYMTYYRDGVPGFCPSPTGSTFNGSNGWTIQW